MGRGRGLRHRGSLPQPRLDPACVAVTVRARCVLPSAPDIEHGLVGQCVAAGIRVRRRAGDPQQVDESRDAQSPLAVTTSSALRARSPKPVLPPGDVSTIRRSAERSSSTVVHYAGPMRGAPRSAWSGRRVSAAADDEGDSLGAVGRDVQSVSASRVLVQETDGSAMAATSAVPTIAQPTSLMSPPPIGQAPAPASMTVERNPNTEFPLRVGDRSRGAHRRRGEWSGLRLLVRHIPTRVSGAGHTTDLGRSCVATRKVLRVIAGSVASVLSSACYSEDDARRSGLSVRARRWWRRPCAPGQPERRLPGREFAVEVRSGHAAVHEEVAGGDERAVGAQEERADGPDLVRS